MGWAMSAWSFTRPWTAAPWPGCCWFIERVSSSRMPQPLQNRARRWFFSPHRRQWSHSLRDGMARNRPSLPSISLTSRMTKVLSNVSEQNALRRLAPLPHKLMRTSVTCISVPLGHLGPDETRCERLPVALGVRRVRREEDAASATGCYRSRGAVLLDFHSTTPRERGG